MSRQALPQIDAGALVRLRGARPHLSAQQHKTLRGQVLAGDSDGAMRGLRKILLLEGSNAIKTGNKRFTKKERQ
jgi:hypothetical protein